MHTTSYNRTNRRARKGLRCLIALVLVLVLAFAVVPVRAGNSISEEDITAHAAMVLDQDTGYVFYSKNPTEQIHPASTTKILTAVLVIETLDMEEEITVGDELDGVRAGSSLMGLKKGEVHKVKDLLYGMMLLSGNDAALVLAKRIGGTVSDFASMMNDKALEIGMQNTHFVNPHGLDHDEHLTTVEDMAVLTRYAMNEHEEFRKLVSTVSYDLPKTNKQEARTIYTTNKFLYNEKPEDDERYKFSSCTGVKTGTTPRGGCCLVAAASEGGQNLIALVYGDKSLDDKGNTSGANRYKTGKTLLRYGFDNFENVTIRSLIASCEMTVQVADAAENDINHGLIEVLPAEEEEELVTLSSSVSDMDSSTKVQGFVVPKEGLAAPIKQGEVVGTAKYILGDRVIYEGDVLAARAVQSQEEYEAAQEGAVSVLNPEDAEERAGMEAEEMKLMWLWLLIPAGGLIFLIIRYALLKGKRRHRSTQMRRNSHKPAVRRRTTIHRKYRGGSRRL